MPAVDGCKALDSTRRDLFREHAGRLMRLEPPSVQRPNVEILADSTALPDPPLYPYQSHVRQLLQGMSARPCNILVASPTGSGKTFAIEEAARLVLASPSAHLFVAQPLIALAEQVFARLGGPDNAAIALRTGPARCGDDDDARVTVCTYEVLARRCLTNPGALDASSMVIIDEVHYIASERGPVLQEILFACARKPVVALSGTLPNARQFAEFLGSINELPTFVTGARERPVPLDFFYYCSQTQRCCALRQATRPCAVEPKHIGGLHSLQDLLACLRCLGKHDSMPALVVLFSCRKLDEMAHWASTALDFLSGVEKSRVVCAFNAMERRVPAEDRVLFVDLRTQALRGIGRHHSHLPVPYLELLCRLAEQRLIHVVFSSSTLSAGINLPVRTVLLCGAKMPRKTSSGNMDFELVSPLLFKQLAGRAGRPGLEPRGYCVVAGKGSDGYASAQGLVERPQEAVKPHDALSQGDVLRGLLLGRRAGHDKAVFANPSLRARLQFGVHLRQQVEALRERFLDIGEDKESLTLVAALHTIMANAEALPLARTRETGVGKAVWRDDDGWFRVDPLVESPAGAIALGSNSQRKAAIPLQHYEEVQAVRAALRIVAQATEVALLLASVELHITDFEESCLACPLMLEEQRLLSAIPSPYLTDSRSTLTPLGQAACAIRSVGEPCAVLDLLLAAGQVSGEVLAALLSQALADGRCADAQEECVAFPRVQALRSDFPNLKTWQCLTEPALTEAAALWLEGGALVDITCATECSVGAVARHLLRVHDFMLEIAEAGQLLQVDTIPLQCHATANKLARGLPFLKRGVGRPAPEEETAPMRNCTRT